MSVPKTVPGVAAGERTRTRALSVVVPAKNDPAAAQLCIRGKLEVAAGVAFQMDAGAV
jgi:hypothetical protein